MNPFPGMNPYLEESDLWRTIHAALIYLTFESINAQLPTGFRASIDERITIEPPHQDVLPDVMVTRRLSPPPTTLGSSQGRTALLEAPEQHGFFNAEPLRIPERFLRIVTGSDWKQVVTVIEILSPTNKSNKTKQRRTYRTKQRYLINCDTNLVEIDLLRGGVHTVAAPESQLKQYGTWDYVMSLHRFWMPDQFEYWLNRLPESLPEITIPLLPDMEELSLDLQSLLNRAYQQGRFDEAIDYSLSPPVPFTPDQEEWADVLLREKGVRK